MRVLLPLAALLLVAAPAAAARPDPQAQLDRLIGDRQPGAPIQCITILPTTGSTTIDRLGTVYQNGSTLYLNRFEQGCPELTFDSFLVTRQPTGQLCRGDIALIQSRTQPAIPRGSCIFGMFTPYAKVKTK